MIRMIFSTVRAPQEPAFTVGSLAIRRRRPAVDRAAAGDHAVGRQTVGQGVGEQAVLDERAVVEEQGDPVADEELVRAASLAAARGEGARARSRARDRLAIRCRISSLLDREAEPRAISMRCTSEVPSPISRTFASR